MTRNERQSAHRIEAEPAVAATEERSVAPALTKGFAILDLVAREPGLNFAAIRTRLDLPNSSCHHLIATLCQLGALQQQPDRSHLLGLRLFELGSIAASQRHIERFAQPVLKQLAHDVQLTCHLGVMEGAEAVYLMKIEGNLRMHVNTWVGKRLSMHSSSLGKVLLAWLPEDELARKLARFTWEAKCPRTITTPMAYRASLQEVRERGWALDDEEDIADIRCVAAPIFDVNGGVIAAISAVGTVLDISDERFTLLAQEVSAAAQKISSALGHDKDSGPARQTRKHNNFINSGGRDHGDTTTRTR
ncbi:MAG: IclR family transcriptional regulator [Rhodocyclaceae bacterium]